MVCAVCTRVNPKNQCLLRSIICDIGELWCILRNTARGF